MVKEAEKYNNPDDFAKHGKLQRQIIQKEKVLKIMKNERKEQKEKE